jgi:hypothetical protein
MLHETYREMQGPATVSIDMDAGELNLHEIMKMMAYSDIGADEDDRFRQAYGRDCVSDAKARLRKALDGKADEKAPTKK